MANNVNQKQTAIHEIKIMINDFKKADREIVANYILGFIHACERFNIIDAIEKQALETYILHEGNEDFKPDFF